MIRGNKLLYFLSILFFVNIINSQSGDEDFRIAKKIIFNEVDVSYDYNPYLKKKSKQDTDNKKIRLYALLHETIIEPDNGTDARYNFTRTHNKKPTCQIYDEPLDGIKSTLTIELPTENIDLPWKFKNGNNITANDIKYSIIYAICSGMIKEDLIPIDGVEIVGNSVLIKSPTIPSERYYHNYLRDLYVIPASCFGDFISLSEEHGCSHITDRKTIGTEYYQDDCRDGWAKGTVDIIDNTGPFSLQEVKSTEIELKKNPNYLFSRKADGFVIKATPLVTSWASNMEDGQTNLGIGIPKKAFTGLAGYHESELKNLSVNLIWINHHSRVKHMKNKEFRKAIYYAINKTQMLTDNLNHDAKLVSGPISDFSDFADREINDWTIGYGPPEYDEDYHKATQILERIGYKIVERSGRKILFDDRNNQVKLSLLYHKNGITEGEEDALETAIKNLSKIGIDVEKDDQDFKNNFEKIKKSGEFDLCYDKITIEEPMDLLVYYHSKGVKNVSRFHHNQVDNLLDNMKDVSAIQANNLAGDVWEILHKEASSVFLWRMNSWYYFNRDYIGKGNMKYVNSKYFFLTPEKWEME